MTNANAGMIKHIETLKSALEGKRIYVWDTARKAVWVFSTLALRGIDVAGFVTNFEEFVGESIMGRPIISLEEFSQIENAVAIVDDDVRSGAFSVIASAGEALYRKEALELNPALQNASLYVFGIDDNTWRIAKRLAREGVEIRGFITDGQSNGETILGLPVTGLSEGNLTSDDAILVPADVDRYLDAELASIIESGFGGTVFIHEVTCRWEIWSHSLVPGIDRALKQRKRMLLCCADDYSRQLLHRMFSLYGVEVAREVFCGEGDDSENDIWSLADEDPEQCALVLGAFAEPQMLELMDAACDLGYKQGELGFFALQKAVYNKLLMEGILAYESDDKLGASIDYSRIGGRPGWMVFGDEHGAELRIIVLGGSTSTILYHPESWVVKLSKLLRANGVKAVIFDGANEGEGAMRELDRLIRDIHALRPDFVISLSGVNDQRSLTEKFERNRDESPFECWRRAESYLKVISEYEGAQFIGILQPMNACMKAESLEENMLFMSENHKWGKTFLGGMRDDDFYVNLLGLFHHQDGMFIDRAHYTDKAAQILAEHVYQELEGRM